jgi:CheY-like chemotaxis protein
MPEANLLNVPVSSLIPNILVVDDDPVVRSQLVRLYTHSGYTVVPVGSAEDALKQLADGNIDFVITDHYCPVKFGIKTVGYRS